MSAVGLALVGAGPWGRTLARTVARLPGVDLRWICELDPARRSEAAAVAPQARLTESLDEALSDRGVAAALVAVDSPRHHSVGLRVLNADRHLLVEKPMALTVADATELNTVAQARQRILAVGHLLLHHPAVRRARQLLDEGLLGQPLWMESARLAPGLPRPGDNVWWTLAPHDISLALHLFAAIPTRVTAVGGAASASGEKTVVWATLHFPDGRLAHIHAARRAAEKRRGFSIVGTERSLQFDELSVESVLRIRGRAVEGAALPDEIVRADGPDALSAQCLEFVNGVLRADPRVGNGGHALAVVRILEAGARSMRAGGAPVDLA